MIKYLAVATITSVAGIALAHPDGHDQASQDRTRPSRSPASTPAQAMPAPQVRMEIKDGVRHIYANGIPNHATGQFPNRRNPNSISAQQYHFMMPATPTVSETTQPVGMGFFGIANNGIPFEAGTAEWWKGDRNSGWHIEANTGFADLGLDMNHAHVQPSGAYHYHGLPTVWLEALRSKPGAKAPQHLGWAADGYPIYAQLGYSDPMDPQSELKSLQPSYQVKPGTRPEPPTGPGGRFDGRYEEDFVYVAGSGDLDEFNGRFGKTPEFPQGTYYYVVTDAFPNVARSWKGVPDQSFKSKGRGGGGRGPGRGAGPGGDRPPQRPGRPPRRPGGRGGA